MLKNVPVLPELLQSSILALLSASIPLSMTLTAILISVKENGGVAPSPSAQDLEAATSIHVLAFSSHGDLLVVESEGYFTMDTWEKVYAKARLICHGEKEEDSESEDLSMDTEEVTKLEDILKDAVRQKVAAEYRWKQSPDSAAT